MRRVCADVISLDTCKRQSDLISPKRHFSRKVQRISSGSDSADSTSHGVQTTFLDGLAHQISEVYLTLANKIACFVSFSFILPSADPSNDFTATHLRFYSNSVSDDRHMYDCESLFYVGLLSKNTLHSVIIQSI